MQLQFNFTFSHIYLTALVVLLTWASLAQGAAINRDFSPSRRDLGERAGSLGIDVSNGDIMRRDGIVSTTDTDGPDGFIDDQSLAARATENTNEELTADGNGDLSRRWYTLIEIAEAPESE